MTTTHRTQGGHLNIEDAIYEALRRRWTMWADDEDDDPAPLAKAIAEDDGVREYDTRIAANIRHHIGEQRALPWTGSPSLSAQDAYETAFQEIEALLP